MPFPQIILRCVGGLKTVEHILVQADIFSYGVILREIVTHEQPHGGGLRDCRVPQEGPAEIDQLIDSCLSQDPDERPTARDICERIRQWQQVTLTALKTARRSVEIESSDGGSK